MRETPFSNIEKTFLKRALSERKRLDGRHIDERRRIQINFGKEYGCCHVSLGETRVLAQVSSEIQQPKSTRPNEGHVYINVEFSPMSAQHVEPGKPSEACVIVNRVLEKCIRESKCIDLESLCIVAEDKVWALRVDVTVLNIEGNVIECSSIAALAALAHFRRPDVTSTGDGIVIHDSSDKEPLPTALHHFPVCLTYAIFNKGRHIVADPTLIEEETAEASLSVGMNAYRELCGIHLGGKAISDPDSVLKVVQKAGAAAAEIVQFIKESLAADEKARANNEVCGLSACIRAGNITTLCNQRMKIKVDGQSIQEAAEKLVARRHKNKHIKWGEDGEPYEIAPSDKIVVNIGENSAELRDMDDDMEEMSEDDENEEEKDEEEEEEGEGNAVEDEEMEEETIPEVEEKKPKKLKQKKKEKEAGRKATTSKVQEISIIDDSDDDGADDDDDDLQVVQELTKEEKERMKNVETLVLDDSEEEETTTLTSGEVETPSSKPKQTPPSKRKRKKNKNKNKNKVDGNVKATVTKNESGKDVRGWYPKSENAW
ncbi:hypothetical protein ONE63_002830 [Megalurothrips usitatus]|uniref:Exosome complex component RRP45 n=1 Tax=Megalurothrips usitatus TaxID=439358 RepID=A0AAV7X984_9NEOP|nr:hypothetical protein ONE63_002830 [Megalurothrips usitatus]